MVLSLLVLVLLISYSPGWSEGRSGNIVFADYGWNLCQFHNRLAGFILEKGYQEPVEYLFVEHIAGLVGLDRGDIDIYMDLWPNNCKEWWDEVQAKGTVVQLSVNYDGGTQGWYVPSYVVKGDQERGIEPMVPDLKSVLDLKEYWEVFRDPEEKDKGRFLNGPGSWVAFGVNNHKLKSYGLEDTFISFSAGSTTGIEVEVAAAYKKGKPILFYFWDPTWLMGKYDFIRLEEPPFDPVLWTPEEGYSCDWVKGTSFIVAHRTFPEKHPDAGAFLSRYSTTLEQNRAALVYIRENETTSEEAAIWFLKTYPEAWRSWIPSDRPEILERVEEALAED